ncbi:MAG TPA: hypothetical protein VMD78_08005, partial [Candidatus Baltobacteraceae bacterium]|nr:hypothetical protein [Candidatus Baltobacteraceae bacterium]
HDNELLSGLRASLQAANLNELCTVADGQRREGLAALLSNVLERATALSDAIEHLYFSHAAVSPVLWQMPEEQPS